MLDLNVSSDQLNSVIGIIGSIVIIIVIIDSMIPLEDFVLVVCMVKILNCPTFTLLYDIPINVVDGDNSAVFLYNVIFHMCLLSPRAGCSVRVVRRTRSNFAGFTSKHISSGAAAADCRQRQAQKSNLVAGGSSVSGAYNRRELWEDCVHENVNGLNCRLLDF